MTLRLCPNSNPCPEDQPLDNFSSEGDDTLDYISTFYSGGPPPLLQQWTATECGVTYVSNISQADADLQARSAAVTCDNSHRNPSIDLIFNAPQTCCIPCPDGTLTCYTVPGGLFTAATQAEADSEAYQEACILASRNPICLGNLPGCTCVGSQYDATVTVTGALSTFRLSGGSLPIGLSLSGTSIMGTPLSPGIYVFQLEAVSTSGSYSIKTYSITVLQITTVSLPPYTIGVPYSFQLQATGGSNNYAWKISSGSLPAGLTMSVSGLISGVPT